VRRGHPPPRAAASHTVIAADIILHARMCSDHSRCANLLRCADRRQGNERHLTLHWHIFSGLRGIKEAIACTGESGFAMSDAERGGFARLGNFLWEWGGNAREGIYKSGTFGPHAHFRMCTLRMYISPWVWR
jgi:hypothetical protein